MNKLFKEVHSELKNVTWPTKKHAIRISKITIWFTLVCAVMLWVTDFLLSEWYDFLSALNPDNAFPEVYPNSTWTWAGSWASFEIESITTSTWADAPVEATFTWDLVLPE